MPLSFQERAAASRVRVNRPYTVGLNNLRPIPLGGDQRISLTVGHRFDTRRIEHLDAYEAESISYFYSLLTSSDIEILTFQWTPAAVDSVTFPHVHVGRAIVSDQTLIMPERFHKVHVPTGHVTLAAVARMVIEEFEVKPVTRRWRSVLEHAEHAELAGLGLLRNR